MGKEIRGCVIISGAPEKDIDYYKNYIGSRFVISADSGYLKCAKLGIIPDLIIGDFDSSLKPDIDTEIITLPVMKDDTDTFSAVKEAINRGFDDIIILGAIGSRVDHTYSNILCLSFCLDKKVNCKLINKNNEIFLIDKETEIKKGNYKFFSIFAMFVKCSGVSVSGALYELENRELLPTEQYTQSNEFSNDTVKISLSSGKLLVVLSND